MKKQDKKTTKHLVSLLSFELLGGVVVNLFSLWVFVELSESVLSREIDQFDVMVSYVVQSLRSPYMTEFMKNITLFGGPGILLGTLTIMAGLLIYKHKRRSLGFLTLMITGIILNIVLKFLFARERPSDARLVDEYFYSFPSGHAMNSFIFYGSIAYLFYHYTRDRVLGIAVAIALGILILLIGISRIYLGVHYPSDVVAGYIAGGWWLVTVLLFEKVYYKHGLRSQDDLRV